MKAAEKSWRVWRMRDKGLLELGTVYTRDEAEAVAKAIEEFDVPKPLQNRVLVRLAGRQSFFFAE